MTVKDRPCFEIVISEAWMAAAIRALEEWVDADRYAKSEKNQQVRTAWAAKAREMQVEAERCEVQSKLVLDLMK